jgi:hypothetical protein
MEIELLLQQIISNKLQCLKKTVDKQSEKKVHFITIYKDSNFDEQNELKNQGIILIDCPIMLIMFLSILSITVKARCLKH